MSSTTSTTISPAPGGEASTCSLWRRAREALSFSSVRAREETATHLLRVGRCSRIDVGEVLPGEPIASAVFRAGGRRWKLLYYPNGAHKHSPPGHAAVQLLQMRRFMSFDWDATAAYRVSVVGRDGTPASSCSVGLHSYHEGLPCTPVTLLDAAAPEETPAVGLMEDDAMVVRCDVTVFSLQKESRIRWCLRQFIKSVMPN
ncbi:hypothetical protein ACP4OV_001943 [Aristida adscensionis]